MCPKKSRRRSFPGLAFVLLLTGACISAPAPTETPTPALTQPQAAAPVPGPATFVIDTDLGMDDVMAILYLVQRPGVDLRAVTVSGTGLTHCAPGTRNALALLARAGAPQVPVACGRERPLQGDAHFPRT